MLTSIETIKIARTALNNAELWYSLDEAEGDVMAYPPHSGLAAKVLRGDLDWSECSAVQRIPGRVSGQWTVRGTRIPVQALIQNYNAGRSPEQLATEVFVGLPVILAREIIRYASERS